MCDCPLHFDADATCNCSCDHDVEVAIEDIFNALHNRLMEWEPELIKLLAEAVRHGSNSREDASST